MAADAANESGAQVWVPETALRATYMDFSISLNFNFDFFSLLCRDYFKLRFLRMADVNVTLRYMYGLVKKNFTSQFTDVNSYFVTQTPIGLRRTARFVTFVHRRKIKSPDRVLRVMQIIKRARMERKSAHQVPRLMQVTRA